MFPQQNELKLLVVSLKEVQESLKTKIVDSPEKVKNYKEKMKDTVQKLKSSRVSLLRRVHAPRRGGGPRLSGADSGPVASALGSPTWSKGEGGSQVFAQGCSPGLRPCSGRSKRMPGLRRRRYFVLKEKGVKRF